MYSYTRTLCSSSQQYPINLTILGCLSCPRKTSSAYTIREAHTINQKYFHPTIYLEQDICGLIVVETTLRVRWIDIWQVNIPRHFKIETQVCNG